MTRTRKAGRKVERRVTKAAVLGSNRGRPITRLAVVVLRDMSARYARPRRLRQVLDNLHQALEGFESALLEFEAELDGEASVRPQERRGLELLSIPEVCQELAMGKSWVYRRIKSGEIPSVKLGRNIKVRREDLEKYLRSQRYRPPGGEPLEGE